MLKRTLGLILVLGVLFFSQASYVQAETGKSFSVLGYEAADQNRNWQEHSFFKRIQEHSGIMLQLEQITDLQAYQQRLVGLQAGQDNLPDVLFKASLGYQQIADLYERGILVDLRPYLAQYAPNFNALMESNPVIRQSISLPDGAIPALPYISLTPSQNILWINKKWLEELRLQVPETIEQLTDTLRAFKDRDPNRNGRSDEVPLSFIGPYDIKYLLSAWGLAANDYNIFVENHSVHYLPEEEGFTQFLHWSKDAFAQGLLDKDGFRTVDTLRRQTDAKAANRYGAFFAPLPNHVVPLEWVNDYQALPPLMYQGQQVYRQIASPVANGNFAITTACDDIPAMLSWVDYLYTQQGAVLAAIGLEGADYVVDGDGTWRLLWENNDTTYLAQSVIAADTSIPGISTEVFQQQYADPTVAYLSQQTALVAEHAVMPFPPYSLTAQEQAQVSALQSDLGKYIDESLVRFITGEWPLDDAHLQMFREELKILGATQFIAAWQNILNRGVQLDALQGSN